MTMNQVNPAPPNPSASLLMMISGYRVTQAIYVAAKLGVADRLVEGPRHVDDLATATGAHAGSLHRLLRALASVGIFVEGPEAGQFALTPMANLLRRGVPGSLHGQAALMGEPFIWQVSGELLSSVRTGETAHAKVFGVDIWKYLEDHPDAQTLFDAAMTSLSALETDAILAAWDFAGPTTVVDVGGGEGALLAAIVGAHPGLAGVLFDQPQVIPRARAFLDGKPEIAGRCRVVGGDLFVAVPPGADVYLLKRVLHDWDDEKAAAILGVCRAAMPEAGRLLLAEPMIPPGNTPHPAKFLDLQMLVSQGGRERTAEELKVLLQAAGLELVRVVPTRSMLTLIEARRR